MERGVFQFVFRYSKAQQLVLILVVIASLPFYFFSLDIPKQIVDKAIKGIDNGVVFPLNYYGLQLEQIEFLLVLCALFLVLVVVNGGFKFFLNVYRGAAGERLLRR
ncbi:MAG: ABC transporter ATP-binding protein, partial [Rhodospirillales bacterium]|nr:ABC transporter ATP-binding protein [Rhodospirillales bacterium]